MTSPVTEFQLRLMSRWRLEVPDDLGKRAIDATGESGEAGDQGDRDEGDDQGVLDQALPLVLAVLQDLENGREILNHIGLLPDVRQLLPENQTLNILNEAAGSTRRS